VWRYEAEHLAYGIPFPSLRERFQRLEEQLSILTGFWSTPAGESYEFRGEHYTLGPGPALPKPLQHPHPPVIVGGLGTRRTPALAARFAAEFNVPFADVDTAGKRFEGVRAACEVAGHDPDELVYSRSSSAAPSASAATWRSCGAPARPARRRRWSNGCANTLAPERRGHICR
jgi:alkanesulfonate monooxygenase SsuD/methylene tetrahydromethanopterin reductase-like flavin-dependent oxidoreductase (luciferase family)